MNRSKLLFDCIVGRRLRGFHRGGGAAGKSTSQRLLTSVDSAVEPGNFDNINNLDDALCLYRRMIRTNPLPPVECFTHLLDSVVNLKEYSAAASLHKDFCISGVPVDKYTMNIVINCYCLSGRVDYGFSILGSFFKRGCIPDKVTFGTLLKGLVLECKLGREEELLMEVIIREKSEMTVAQYNSVIDGLCKVGNTHQALELIKFMERVGCELDVPKGLVPNINSYTILVNGYCQEYKIEEAMEIFQKISDNGLQPRIGTYSAILQGLFLVGRCDEAWKIYDEIEASGCPMDDIIIDGLCNNKKTEEALNFLHSLEQKKKFTADIIMYNIIIKGLCKDGKLDTARNLFNELSSKGLQPDEFTYRIMIRGYCQAGLLKEMKSFLIEHGREEEEFFITTPGSHHSFEGDEEEEFLEGDEEEGFLEGDEEEGFLEPPY